MSAIGRRLMRMGRPDEGLPGAVREAIGRVRADVGRFTVGQAAEGRVLIEGAALVVELRGRGARCVAQQVARRVRGALVATVADTADGVRVRIEERSNAN